MIIFRANGGRLGNQILQLIHLYASALEFGIRIYRNGGKLPSGIESSLSPSIIQDDEAPCWAKFIMRMMMGESMKRKIARKLLSCVVWVTRYRNPGLLPGQCVREIETASKRFGIADYQVWPYYHFEAVYKWQDTIRNHIRFSSEKQKEATAYLESIGAQGCTLVGVHLRRTDYKEWMNGRYYYPLSLYCKLIHQAAECLPGKLKFLIFSDETITAEQLSASELDVSFSRNSFITDLVLLSRCHYLIGPPSTFSGTASFLGKAKKFTIYSADSNILSEEDFGVVGIDYETAPSLVISEPTESKLRGYVKLREGKIVSIHTPQ